MSERFDDWFRRAYPEQAAALIGSGHPGLIMMEAAYHDGAVEEQIRILSAATRLAMANGQVSGDDSAYFVTMEQLGNLLKDDPLSPSPQNQVRGLRFRSGG